MTKSSEKEARRQTLLQRLERKRKRLGLSKRKLSIEAGLEPSYYGHFVAGQFVMPGNDRVELIEEALNRVEQLEQIKADMLARASHV